MNQLNSWATKSAVDTDCLSSDVPGNDMNIVD